MFAPQDAYDTVSAPPAWALRAEVLESPGASLGAANGSHFNLTAEVCCMRSGAPVVVPGNCVLDGEAMSWTHFALTYRLESSAWAGSALDGAPSSDDDSGAWGAAGASAANGEYSEQWASVRSSNSGAAGPDDTGGLGAYGTAVFSLYLDGERCGGGAVTDFDATLMSSVAPVTLGAEGDHYMHGALHSFAFYDFAQTEAEVHSVFQRDHAGDVRSDRSQEYTSATEQDPHITISSGELLAE